MTRLSAQNREAAEDLYFGQIVMIWARWFVILATAILALWSSDDTGALARRALLVVGLMGVNFFLHGRLISGKPANQTLLLGTSLIDLVLVGSMVGVWSTGGLASELYVLYYPLLFAFALVFPQRLTAVYGFLTTLSYVAICVLTDSDMLTSSADARTLAMRLITLGATAGLGAFYWRIQRQRRHLAHGPFEASGAR